MATASTSSPVRVSVVIPTYNRRGVVPEAVAAALGQTLSDIEVVVVDDGSTDGTAEALRERFSGDPRLRVLRQRNGGAPAARNAGIDQARGAFVAMLDSDDLWRPEYLARQVAVLQRRGDVDMVLCNGICREADGRVLRLSEYPNWVLPDSLEAMCRGTWMLPSFSLMRTEVARTVRFDASLRLCDDTDFMFRFLIAGHRLAGNPEPLAEYRAVADGATPDAQQLSADDDRLLLATYDVWKRYGADLPQMFDRGPAFHLEYGERLLRGGRPAEARWHAEWLLRERPGDPAGLDLLERCGTAPAPGPSPVAAGER